VITFDYANEVAQASCLPRPSNRRRSSSRDGCATFHGEIFICVNEAILQARKFDTSWQSEVVRYIIHGVLHLLGFDDSTAGTRRKMKLEENRRLREMTRRFPLSKL
jgi:rRNA maturation RNase YbeY